MHIHEYQAKVLLAQQGVPVPPGQVAKSAEEALTAAAKLGGESWMVKAQVHAGGRGKAGGVRKVEGRSALDEAVKNLIGTRLVTPQTDAQGQPVASVLIEVPCTIARELYLACLVDRARERVTLIASREGGMDIEAVAARDPEAILQAVVDPVAGLQAYQCREIAFALGLQEKQIGEFTKIALALYRLFTERDLSLIEINPLVVTDAGALLALDAKINVDDSALYRQQALAHQEDPSQIDDKEQRARQFDLNYIALSGNIGCMVNGAGLAMATMDLIKLHGGEPANFLDVGGGTTAEKVAQAFKIICSDPSVKVILVNIFGGIVRCDLIAEGIIQAVRETGLSVAVVVRLEGTNVERGRELLQQSGLKIETAADLADAARKAVAAARS